MPHTLDICRQGSDDPFVTIKPDDNSTQNKTIMGENFLALEFEIGFQVPFRMNDHCTVFGEDYSIWEMPVETKLSNYNYRYSLKMHSAATELLKAQFLFLDPDNHLYEPEFSIMGNAQTFIDLLLTNAGRFLAGWTKGEVINTDYKNITFSNDDCLSALGKIAEAFGTEWWIMGKVIHLTKKLNDTAIGFKYGQNNGLYEITRTPAQGIITRVYPFGSDKNIPSDYGSKRLRLTVLSDYSISNVQCTLTPQTGPWAGYSMYNFTWTAPISPDVTTIIVKWRPAGSSIAFAQTSVAVGTGFGLQLPTATYEFIFVSQPQNITTEMVTIGPSGTTAPLVTGFSNPYVENNTNLHGIIEQTQVFDDIYPRRTGVVSGVDATDPFKFTDADIDFNVNSQLLPGLVAKVVFNTGQLAGYQFEISSFNNGTKEFKILKNKDETSLDVPSSLIKPAIGDKYVLVDMKMPVSYIKAAENELLNKALDLLTRYSTPNYTYNVTIDPVFIKTKGYVISIGDNVLITDAEFQINRKIRVVNTVRNVVNENQFQITLSDEVPTSKIDSINSNISSVQTGVSQLASQVQNAALNNNKQIGNLTIEQGTLIMPDLPTTNTMTGFENVVRKISTGELHRKI